MVEHHGIADHGFLSQPAHDGSDAVGVPQWDHGRQQCPIPGNHGHRALTVTDIDPNVFHSLPLRIHAGDPLTEYLAVLHQGWFYSTLTRRGQEHEQCGLLRRVVYFLHAQAGQVAVHSV